MIIMVFKIYQLNRKTCKITDSYQNAFDKDYVFSVERLANNSRSYLYVLLKSCFIYFYSLK